MRLFVFRDALNAIGPVIPAWTKNALAVYNDSGAVAASSHTLVASSTWARTVWRTRS
jgi:hypothetical protein